MRRRSLGALCALALCAASGSAAQAATVTLNQTINLNDATRGTFLWSFENPTDFPAFSLTLNEGDVLDWTINFAPGQSISFYETHFFFPILTPQLSSQFQSGASTLELLNNGATTATFSSTGGISAYLVAPFDPPDVWGPNPTIFNALHVIMPLADIRVPNDATSRTFNGAILNFSGRTEAPPIQEVPEPATWAMMIVGFGMVGAGLRMRRRTAGALATA